MSSYFQDIPLSLYIHIPWCIKKCPYCDFNSHVANDAIDETAYIRALIEDLKCDLALAAPRPLHSIFIGGGTPSLFSSSAIDNLLTQVRDHIEFAADIEITLEANPGTFEQERFAGFRHAGVNRLSIGIQSFQEEKLKALGRIHTGQEAMHVAAAVRSAGFDNFNLDLMHGLPQQSLQEALSDLETALSFQPNHLSWYQLTIEKNTKFYRFPPQLPEAEQLWEIEQEGKKLLAANQFQHYEISAYRQKDKHCRHNMNYWQFGDYLGIGAGAHSKISDPHTQQVKRAWKKRQPKDYLNPQTPFVADQTTLTSENLAFEFMLNALRLNQDIPFTLFETRTGLSSDIIADPLEKAYQRELMIGDNNGFKTTKLGQRFLNDVLTLFMAD